MNNIKIIYQNTGKCADQQNLKDMIYASMFSTSLKIIYDSTSLPMTQKAVKNQVPVNHYVFLPKYLMLKLKQQNILLELQNQKVDPLKLVIACGTIKQNKKGIQK